MTKEEHLKNIFNFLRAKKLTPYESYEDYCRATDRPIVKETKDYPEDITEEDKKIYDKMFNS